MYQPMALLHEAEEKYGIVVLLTNSELTEGNNKCDADAHTVRFTTEDHGGWTL